MKPQPDSVVDRLEPSQYRDIVRRALEEDVGSGDLTTCATVQPDARARGVFIAKADCVVAGCDVAAEVFRQVSDRDAVPSFSIRRQDGERSHRLSPVLAAMRSRPDSIAAVGLHPQPRGEWPLSTTTTTAAITCIARQARSAAP